MEQTTHILDESTAAEASKKLKELQAAVNSVIFGQEALVDLIIVALLSRGHLLLEGLPGLGKTEMVKTFSGLLGLETGRVQFTPDLLPGDITGSPMLTEVDGVRKFTFQQGPVFTNLLLADEINRASPKTQSALLEAMQEQSVTVANESHRLPQPFFVFATQNPIELEGTYPLPEAQLDRFLFKLQITRAGPGVLERIIENRRPGVEVQSTPMMTADSLSELIESASKVFLPKVVARYIARLVESTHPGEMEGNELVKFGASPRAAIGMAAAGRARALLHGRLNVSCEDVQAIAPSILGHRVVMNYQARMEGLDAQTFVGNLLEKVSPEEAPLPRSLKTAKIR
ncbi:MAG: AAA family ATPase [Opitutaceae bacterium]